MTTTPQKKVLLRPEGKDYHGEGCDCGKCNSNGHAYDCRVYDVSQWPQEAVQQGEVLDEYLDLLTHEDPCYVEYGPSEEAAKEHCWAYCEKEGWEVLSLVETCSDCGTTHPGEYGFIMGHQPGVLLCATCREPRHECAGGCGFITHRVYMVAAAHHDEDATPADVTRYSCLDCAPK